jgi:hypothetical protein
VSALAQRGAPPSSERPALTTIGCQATEPHQDMPPEDQRRKVVVAVAFVAPPSGRRRLHTLVVVRCPRCGAMHFHRSTGAHGGQRTGSCGASYVVVIAGHGRGIS